MDSMLSQSKSQLAFLKETHKLTENCIWKKDLEVPKSFWLLYMEGIRGTRTEVGRLVKRLLLEVVATWGNEDE